MEYIFLLDLKKKLEEAKHDAINFFEKKCPYCKRDLYAGTIRSEIHVDHFIPIAKGGQDFPWNILPVCKDCNSKKSAAKPKLFLSAEIHEKCEKYLIKVREKYVGQIQIDLEKYAQIKSLFSKVESIFLTKDILIGLTKEVYQIVTDKTYVEEIIEIKHKVSNVERELISKYFTKGDKYSLKLTTTEIMEEIKTLTGTNLSINTLGSELEKLGFVRKTVTKKEDSKQPKKWSIERINR